MFSRAQTLPSGFPVINAWQVYGGAAPPTTPGMAHVTHTCTHTDIHRSFVSNLA
jgi:hypothetical protein